ncbi:MAG: cytochrome c [Chloroflexota bacterium]
MITNLVILIVVVAITIGLALLTYRAVRARRWWVKIAGGLPAALLTLLLAYVSYMGIKGMATLYFTGVGPAPDMTVEGTPEQVARGQYLVNIACTGCHGVQGQFPLAGGLDLAADIPFPVGRAVSSNLTPGGPLADYSDGELFRALRHSVDKNGDLFGFMAFMPYHQLSDDDLKAIIAYLRSETAVQTDHPNGDSFNFLGVLIFGADLYPLLKGEEGVITAPPAGPTAEYGEYVATFGECRGCHGPEMLGAPATVIAGEVPNPRPFVASISVEQFIQTMRTGVRPDGSPLQMPWLNAAKMNDEDLTALYIYLTTAP